MNQDEVGNTKNLFVVTATLMEKEVLRYTPKNLPVCEFKLSYDGHQMEAGLARQVQCELECIALGKLSQSIANLNLGVLLECSGFMARRNNRTQRLQFHVCSVKPV